jgi:hypothetical protein
MSFLQREHDKIRELLQHTPNDHPASGPLQLASQTLAWALDPDMVASPSAVLHRWYKIGDEGTQGTGLPVAGPAPDHAPPAN